MKLHILSLALAAYVSTVAAQGIDGLPACAQPCATNSIPTSCNPIDFACICSNQSFITNISCCIFQSCAADQQAAVLQFADELCSGVGVTDLPKSATCAAGVSISTTNAETTPTDTSSSSTTPASNTASETSSSSTTTATTTGASTSSAKAASSSSAAAAPALNKDASLIAAAGAAAAFALLV